MNFYIKIGTINKAKNDIDDIVESLGYRNLAVHDYGRGGVGRFLTKLTGVAHILTTTKRGDMLFLQYPMKKFYKIATVLAHWKGVRVVTVIHDLGAFRRHKLTAAQENRRLGSTDFIICHNDTMASYLREHGYKGGLHSLEIFDYLSAAEKTGEEKATDGMKPEGDGVPSVVYAGNLGMWRNEFLYHLKGVVNDWTLNLYGNGFDDSKNDCDSLVYHGFIDSDKFISSVSARFGLVWDGSSVDECNGAWGEYLKINNPHKTSFYLRAGIPVIVWSKAAMAPFVRKYGVGMVIDSIRDIDQRMREMSAEDYKKIKDKTEDVGRKLASGYFTKVALKAAHDYFAK
ncbi:MAG: galactofuranosyltransferase [Prevotella sp.]|nr:galactofuranosyltransferase [Prevotella sp.]